MPTCHPHLTEVKSHSTWLAPARERRRHTGILPAFEPHAAVGAIPEVEAAVEAASKALHALNTAICERSDGRQNLAKPELVDNIEELLKEPGDLEWVEDEEDEAALITAVSTGPYGA